MEPLRPHLGPHDRNYCEAHHQIRPRNGSEDGVGDMGKCESGLKGKKEKNKERNECYIIKKRNARRNELGRIEKRSQNRVNKAVGANLRSPFVRLGMTAFTQMESDKREPNK